MPKTGHTGLTVPWVDVDVVWTGTVWGRTAAVELSDLGPIDITVRSGTY